MLFGLGAWATLPAVIGGYIGNPNGNSGWIEGALAQGGRAGRWPDNALDLDGRSVLGLWEILGQNGEIQETIHALTLFTI